MPQREDAFYRRQKEDIRNCPKHRIDYSQKWGCQKCFEERIALRTRKTGTVQLLICPKCKKKSLSWYQQTQRYECSNLRCKIAYTEDDYRVSTQDIEVPLKCPKCGQDTYHLNNFTELYECINSKCLYGLTDFSFANNNFRD